MPLEAFMKVVLRKDETVEFTTTNEGPMKIPLRNENPAEV